MSVLTYAVSCWFGQATESAKCPMKKTVSDLQKLTGNEFDVSVVYEQSVFGLLNRILNDTSHPLNSHFLVV